LESTLFFLPDNSQNDFYTIYDDVLPLELNLPRSKQRNTPLDNSKPISQNQTIVLILLSDLGKKYNQIENFLGFYTQPLLVFLNELIYDH